MTTYNILIGLSIAFLAALIGYASSYFLGKDNPVEESCESIIKEQTGVDIDLTPEDKDTGNKASS